MKGKTFNKIGIFAIMTLVLTLLLSSMVAAASLMPDGTNIIAKKSIKVTMVNQEPNSVEPGQYVDVKFKVENYGSDPTNQIELTLEDMYPFTIVGDKEATKTISGLERRQMADDSEIVTWRLKVDKDAAEGNNELIISYKELGVSKGSVVFEERFFVDVKTSDTVLEIVDITTVPEMMIPGMPTIVTLELKNLGDSFIKDVSVAMDLTNLDIATVKGSAEKIVPKVDGKETFEVSFNMVADSNSDIKVYNIPLKLSFKDNLNTEYTQMSTFGLMLESNINYVIGIDDSEITSKGQNGEVDVKISNPSVGNIRYLSMELVDSEQYKILSSPQIYVGNVDSDDFETVTYNLHVNNGAENTEDVSLRLRLTYKDDYNKEYVAEENVYLPLYSSNELKKYGLVQAQSNGGTIFFIIILIAIGGFVWFKKNKKKKLLLKKNKGKN